MMPTGGGRPSSHPGRCGVSRPSAPATVGPVLLDDAVRLAGRTAARVVTRPQRMDLDGRVLFITGAARGLGAETARRAHARGAQVALVGRTLATLQALADELGPGAAAFEADVTSAEKLQRAAQDAVATFGGIDVIVANAGIAPPSRTVATIAPDAFEHTVEVDLLGQWRTVQAALPSVLERRGHVLLVGSIYAFFNGVLAAPYAVSKAGVEQLARALRVELAPHGVTAGIAYLGFIDTDLANDAFADEAPDAVRPGGPRHLHQGDDRRSGSRRGARRDRAARTEGQCTVLGPAAAGRAVTDHLGDGRCAPPQPRGAGGHHQGGNRCASNGFVTRPVRPSRRSALRAARSW